MKYPFTEVEKKWKKRWEDNKTYKTDLTNLEKALYTLVMFIYPSGSKLHIGHWYNYAPTDSWARYKKLRGYNVFEPMGYDAFGLPAENYAIKTGIHPQDSTFQNIDDIREQLKTMGCMYDWDAELMTCVPEYYKWNQWLFIELYKKGLAYRKNAPVNWCPSCQTVLANEQVQSSGTCERCDTMVERKNLTQWFFKITDYADELLDGLKTIDWPEKTKTMQENWIGKSFGTEVKFGVVGHKDKEIRVFTTRPDTLFGVTYVVLAPELDLVQELTTEEYKSGVEKYIDSIKSLSEIERTSTVKEKTGVFTGAFAINPVNSEKVPIWIADYALATYGTGSVMAVPAHDERDFEFAIKFNLPIRKVILEQGTDESAELTEAFTSSGIMINSGQFNGTDSVEGKSKITEWLSANNVGEKKINYRLRDWLISRQRYWGTPIPVIYCEKCGEMTVPEEQLPVKLPYEVNFKHDGASPLVGNLEFVNTTCPKCGGPATRDVDTMDTFMDSSWYYLRYLNPKFSDGMFDTKLGNDWTPVDMYVGGAEHATMHLLYSRFIHKFLRDIGLVNSDEPFKRLIHQGTITNNGAKMSKSKGNVVNPGSFIEEYGSDVFRMYLMFMGPYELGGDWSDKGIVGVDRFVQRAYSLFESNENISKKVTAKNQFDIESLSQIEKSIYQLVNKTLSKFENEIDNFRFNTAVASLMELNNGLKELTECTDEIKRFALERFATMLAPLAPHMAEECWSIIGNEVGLFDNPVWFEIDEKALVQESVTIIVQVNGKVRAKFDLPLDVEETKVKELAWSDDKVKTHTSEKVIVKEIYIKNKIYNIVVR
jgi:leucyl-tRNA synthetase